MTIKTSGVDHIHFNVRNMKRLNELMEQLFGADMTQVGLLEHLGMYNTTIFFPEGDTKAFLDVFQSADDNSSIAKHIDERGEGVSYVSFRVEGIEDAAEHAKKCGLKEVSRIGFRGLKQVQFDTYAEIGFDIEFVEYEPTFEEQVEEVRERCRNGETVDGLRYVEL